MLRLHPPRATSVPAAECRLAPWILAVSLLAAPLVTGPLAAAAPGHGGSGSRAFHTRLEATFPAADSLYRGEVTEVRLLFSTDVHLPLTTIRVLGPDGSAVAAAAPDTVAGSGGAEIRVRFGAPLPSGAYTVAWRTAGPDSHPIEGTYGFEVEPPEPVGTPDSVEGGERAAAEPDTSSREAVPVSSTAAGGSAGSGGGPLGAVARWLFLASVVAMLGTGVFRFTVLPVLAGERGWEEAARHGYVRLRRLAIAAGILGALALPLGFGVQVVAFAGGDGPPVGSPVAVAWNLLGSASGPGWILGAVAVAAFLAGLFLTREPARQRAGWLVMLAAAALGAVGPAFQGHSRAVEPGLRGLAMAVDSLHVTAAGTWLGGLAALVLVGVGAATRVGGDDVRWALPRVVDAFSRVALVAVGVLLGTGLVNAWLHLGSLGALWGSAYGRTLALKLGLAAGAVALGFYNWRVVRPTLREMPRPALIRGPAGLELVLGVAVLLVTAVLVAIPTPGG